MNVISVVKPFHILVFFRNMKEVIEERNLMSVINVVKPLQVIVVFKMMKNTIILRNLMSIVSVLKHLHPSHHLQIYERNNTGKNL